MLTDHGHFQVQNWVCRCFFHLLFSIVWHFKEFWLLMLILHPYRICQYNCISLGLTVGAVAAVLSNKELVACFLFSLALNHKQVLYNGDLRASCSIPNEFIGSTNELIYIYCLLLHSCQLICLWCMFYCALVQMAAYFAPAFFSHLFGKCLRRQNPLLEISKLGLVVLGTFALVWWPYLHSMEAVLRVNRHSIFTSIFSTT